MVTTKIQLLERKPEIMNSIEIQIKEIKRHVKSVNKLTARDLSNCTCIEMSKDTREHLYSVYKPILQSDNTYTFMGTRVNINNEISFNDVELVYAVNIYSGECYEN